MSASVNIWAHRGCSHRYPENTLSAFAEALRYDITGIELDIQLSKDGHMVVIHDETVDRTCDGTGSVCDMTLAELKELRIQANPQSKLACERIPTIEEVLDLLEKPLLERGLLLNIELKNSEVRYEGMEEQILALVRERGLMRNVIFSSFNPESVGLIKQLEPAASTGVLAYTVSECVELAEKHSADALHPCLHGLGASMPPVRPSMPVRAWNHLPHETFFPSEEPCTRLCTSHVRCYGVSDIFTNVPEDYVGLCERPDRAPQALFFVGKGVDPETGLLRDEPGTAVTWEPLEVLVGDKVRWHVDNLEYQLHFYDAATPHELIDTYCYQPESNWTTFLAGQQDAAWRQGDLAFGRDGYVRIAVRGKDGVPLAAPPAMRDLCTVERRTRPDDVWPACFADEVERVSRRVGELRRPGDAVFIVLADIHCAFGGTWPDTARNVKQLARRVCPDAIIQLGDLTDGLAPAALTKQLSTRVLDDLGSCGAPVLSCIGNHDTNYFRGNPDRFDDATCAELILGQEKPHHVYDVPGANLRLVFLDSFDSTRKVRYGFSLRTRVFLHRMLNLAPRESNIIVFTHVPPLPQIHYWSDQILGGSALMHAIERHNGKPRGKVLAVVHGHNHADQVYLGAQVPIVGLGCAKFEDFKDKKPLGATTPDRERGTASQELFDVLLAHADGTLDFVRFGAGEDRRVGRT